MREVQTLSCETNHLSELSHRWVSFWGTSLRHPVRLPALIFWCLHVTRMCSWGTTFGFLTWKGAPSQARCISILGPLPNPLWEFSCAWLRFVLAVKYFLPWKVLFPQSWGTWTPAPPTGMTLTSAAMRAAASPDGPEGSLRGLRWDHPQLWSFKDKFLNECISVRATILFYSYITLVHNPGKRCYFRMLKFLFTWTCKK